MIPFLPVPVFLAAFLIFQAELMTAKALLPGFGGSYLVWGASVTFFQLLLLLAYLFAHFINQRYTSRVRILLPAALFAAAAALMPVDVLSLLAPFSDPPRFWQIPQMLFLAVGPQFFLLSTVSLLAQHRVADSSDHSSNPYVLYAVSNLGSFAGLVSFPFFSERYFDLAELGRLWQTGFAAVAVLMCLLVFERVSGTPAGVRVVDAGPASSTTERLRWLLLGAAGSALFLATSNILTMDVASIPLLWTAPLAVYLLSFVPTFKNMPWYPAALRDRFAGFVAIGFFLFQLTNLSHKLPPAVALPVYLLVLLAGCLIVNGELSVNKPARPAHLGEFYVCIAVGGLAGSSLVSWIIPLISTRFIEYPAAFLLAALGLSLGRDAKSPGRFIWIRVGILAMVMAVWPWILRVTPDSMSGVVAALCGVAGCACWYRLEKRPLASALLLVAVLVLTPLTDPARFGGALQFNDRNYYGVYKVFDRDGKRYLQHGTTLHGTQYLDPDRRHTALGYYHATTPVGEFLAQDPLGASAVGIVGLGAGGLAAWGKPGQRFDFLELDPGSEPVARNYFTYLADSSAHVRLVFGDARLSLARLADAYYDLLIIDAFNSDAVPVHLLTAEAFSLYARVVRPTGLVMLHVSNKYLDLKPVVAAGAFKAGLLARYKTNAVFAADALTTEWVAIARSPQAASLLDRMGWSEFEPALVSSTTAWTDRYADPVSAFRR
jgi:hypothetical protein